MPFSACLHTRVCQCHHIFNDSSQSLLYLFYGGSSQSSIELPKKKIKPVELTGIAVETASFDTPPMTNPKIIISATECNSTC